MLVRTAASRAVTLLPKTGAGRDGEAAGTEGGGLVCGAAGALVAAVVPGT